MSCEKIDECPPTKNTTQASIAPTSKTSTSAQGAVSRISRGGDKDPAAVGGVVGADAHADGYGQDRDTRCSTSRAQAVAVRRAAQSSGEATATMPDVSADIPLTNLAPGTVTMGFLQKRKKVKAVEAEWELFIGMLSDRGLDEEDQSEFMMDVLEKAKSYEWIVGDQVQHLETF